jgi:hypothetical protein
MRNTKPTATRPRLFTEEQARKIKLRIVETRRRIEDIKLSKGAEHVTGW